MSTLCLEGLFFPVSVGECGTGEQGHLQNPGPPTGSKASIVYHFSLFSVVLIIIQSMASKTRKSDRRHLCFTPVFTINESVVCPDLTCHAFVGTSYQRINFL